MKVLNCILIDYRGRSRTHISMTYQCNHQICSHELELQPRLVQDHRNGGEMFVYAIHLEKLCSNVSSNFWLHSANGNEARSSAGTFCLCLRLRQLSHPSLLKGESLTKLSIMFVVYQHLVKQKQQRLTKIFSHVIKQRQPPLGVKMCSAICQRTKPVPRSKQFPSSEGKLSAPWARQSLGSNIQVNHQPTLNETLQ